MEQYKTHNKNHSSNESHLISVILLVVKMKGFSVLRSFPIAKYNNALLYACCNAEDSILLRLNTNI